MIYRKATGIYLLRFTERAAPPFSSARLVRWICRSAIGIQPRHAPKPLDGGFPKTMNLDGRRSSWLRKLLTANERRGASRSLTIGAVFIHSLSFFSSLVESVILSGGSFFQTGLSSKGILQSLSFDIYRTAQKNVSLDQLFSPGITAMVRGTVGGAGGFEERRKGERYKSLCRGVLRHGVL